MTLVTAKWSLEDYHRMIDTGLLDERRCQWIVSNPLSFLFPRG
jgi:hypothetical protein